MTLTQPSSVTKAKPGIPWNEVKKELGLSAGEGGLVNNYMGQDTSPSQSLSRSHAIGRVNGMFLGGDGMCR